MLHPHILQLQKRLLLPTATKPFPPPATAHSSHHPPTNESAGSQQPAPPRSTSPPRKHQSPVKWCSPLPSVFIFPAHWSKMHSFRRGSALTHPLPHHEHICPFITGCPSQLSLVHPSIIPPSIPLLIPPTPESHPNLNTRTAASLLISSETLTTKEETALNTYSKKERC